jgi:hypothetical protein
VFDGWILMSMIKFQPLSPQTSFARQRESVGYKARPADPMLPAQNLDPHQGPPACLPG